jgi:hypothetical protein
MGMCAGELVGVDRSRYWGQGLLELFLPCGHCCSICRRVYEHNYMYYIVDFTVDRVPLMN